MISPEIKTAFTNGLMNGYAGSGNIDVVKRGGFALNSTHTESSETLYHDEWIGGRLGGGQEIVEVNGEQYTRLYAGGSLDDESLKELGVTREQIDKFRAEALMAGQEETRLNNVYNYESSDGLWLYGYHVNTIDEEVGLITGQELIQFNESNVFVHRFLLSPVK